MAKIFCYSIFFLRILSQLISVRALHGESGGNDLPNCGGKVAKEFFNLEIIVDELSGECNELKLVRIGELIQEVVTEVELTMPEYKQESIDTDVCANPETSTQRFLLSDQSHRRLGRYSYRGGGICRRCRYDNNDRRTLNDSKYSQRRRNLNELEKAKAELESDLGVIEKKLDELEMKRSTARSSKSKKKLDEKLEKYRKKRGTVLKAIKSIDEELRLKEMDESQMHPTPAPVAPTQAPTPTGKPTMSPTAHPTEVPTPSPTLTPTESPTEVPNASPTQAPTKNPTASPTEIPTLMPTVDPTVTPTGSPTKVPTQSPTTSPTLEPTKSPTLPVLEPTKAAKDLSNEEIQSILDEFAEQLQLKQDELVEKKKVADLLSQGLGRSAGGSTQGAQQGNGDRNKALKNLEAASEELTSFENLAAKEKPTPAEKKELLRYALKARNGNVVGAANWDVSAEIDESMEQWFRRFGDKLIVEIPARLVQDFGSTNGGCVDVAPYVECIITELNSWVGQYNPEDCVFPVVTPSSAAASSPLELPTGSPTNKPTKVPTVSPTSPPTKVPTELPTGSPSKVPTELPTSPPTKVPTDTPTSLPTKVPTDAPTRPPTKVPTDAPTRPPTKAPTGTPTDLPTATPTESPTPNPFEPFTLTPIQDTHAKQDRSTKNYGGETRFSVKKNDDRIGYLKFYIGSVTKTAPRVYLRLWAYTDQPKYVTTNLHQVTSSWDEYDLVWNNRPTPGTIIETRPYPRQHESVVFDVTDYVNSQIGADYVSFALTNNMNDALVKFYSREWASSDVRPTLEFRAT